MSYLSNPTLYCSLVCIMPFTDKAPQLHPGTAVMYMLAYGRVQHIGSVNLYLLTGARW